MADVRASSRLQVRRLRKGDALVLSDAECCVLVLRGKCQLQGRANTEESIASGTLLLPDAECERSLDFAVACSLEKMANEPGKRWTVEALARSVGLSRAAFAKRFVAAVGAPPLRYLTELRLELAAARLQSANTSLAELAAALGYASEFAFSRAFKRRFGVAPAFFRRGLSSAPRAVLLRAA